MKPKFYSCKECGVGKRDSGNTEREFAHIFNCRVEVSFEEFSLQADFKPRVPEVSTISCGQIKPIKIRSG